MSDRIQELRANEISPIIREHHAREVWDYEWETWCHILDAALALDALLTEALDGWEKADAELAQLREAGQQWLDHPDQRAHDGHVIEPGSRCVVCDLRAALTQENPDE